MLDWITSKVDLEPAPLWYSAVIPSFAISAALTCALTEFKKLSEDWRFAQALVTAVKLFFKIKESLEEMIIDAKGDVIKATLNINQEFQMENDFPIFMAVIDLAWFRPDIVYPSSHVPTGIGAVAYLDRLQKYLGLISLLHH